MSSDISGADYLRQVVHVDTEHLTHLGAPAPALRPYIIEKSPESRVICHGEIACASEYQVILDIEPFIYTCKKLRLMCLDPFVLPDRILDAAGNGAGYPEARDQLRYIGSGDLDTVGNPLPDLLRRPLVHIAHRAPDSFSVAVHKHQPLHLRAK